MRAFAGPVVQDYRLSPADPGSRLHGLYVGGEFATDIWYQPSPNTMAAVSGTMASIGPTGSVRAAFGFRVFDRFFVGPESGELWCGDFQQVQLGGHVTGFRMDAFEWSAGGGWSMTTDRRAGPICASASMRAIERRPETMQHRWHRATLTGST